MKTFTLCIPPVEAAMLQDLQKSHKQFRNLEGLVLGLIREEHEKQNGSRQAIKKALCRSVGGVSFTDMAGV